MLRKPQALLQPPAISGDVSRKSIDTATTDLSFPHPVSLALVKLQTLTSSPEGVGYETHVRGEAEVAAALVASIQRCCPKDDIFVATPHRIQRQAVKAALARVRNHITAEDILAEGMAKMGLESDHSPAPTPMGNVIVDTVERLQGTMLYVKRLDF